MDKFVLWAMLVFISVASYAERATPFAARAQDASFLNRHKDIAQSDALECALAAGDRVQVIEQTEWRGAYKFISRVEVESGKCRGMSGWLVTSRLDLS